MKAYSIRISDALYADLHQEACKRGKSLSAVARERLTASFAASPAPQRIRAHGLRDRRTAKRTQRP
jgi:hypothetical protein